MRLVTSSFSAKQLLEFDMCLITYNIDISQLLSTPEAHANNNNNNNNNNNTNNNNNINNSVVKSHARTVTTSA